MPSLMNSLPMRAASLYGADHRHLELGPCSAFQALPRSTAVEMPAVLAISTPFLAPGRGETYGPPVGAGSSCHEELAGPGAASPALLL